jgi:hypothetical protein
MYLKFKDRKFLEKQAGCVELVLPGGGMTGVMSKTTGAA